MVVIETSLDLIGPDSRYRVTVNGMLCATVTFSPARILTDAEQARMEDIVSAGFLRAMGLSS